MKDVINSYLHHLAQNPERIDSLLMWTVCTFACWVVLVAYRHRIIKGLEGLNQLFEGAEIVAFIAICCLPPTIFYVLFFTDDYLIALYIVAFIAIYQMTGRYILDWGLAMRTGTKIPDTIEIKSEIQSNIEIK